MNSFTENSANHARYFQESWKPKSWKQDHDDAIFCMDLEEFITVGLFGLKRITALIAQWADYTRQHPAKFRIEDARLFEQTVNSWAVVAREVIAEGKSLRAKGYTVNGLDALEDALAFRPYAAKSVDELMKIAEADEPTNLIPIAEVRDALQRRLRTGS